MRRVSHEKVSRLSELLLHILLRTLECHQTVTNEPNVNFLCCLNNQCGRCSTKQYINHELFLLPIRDSIHQITLPRILLLRDIGFDHFDLLTILHYTTFNPLITSFEQILFSEQFQFLFCLQIIFIFIIFHKFIIL